MVKGNCFVGMFPDLSRYTYACKRISMLNIIDIIMIRDMIH